MQVSMPKITTAWCGHFKMVVKISWLQRKLWLQWTSWTRKMRLIPIIRSMEAHFWNLRDRGFEWKPPGFSILPLSNYMPLAALGMCGGTVKMDWQRHIWLVGQFDDENCCCLFRFFASACIHNYKTMKYDTLPPSIIVETMATIGLRDTPFYH